jgi:hypothetical protein
MGTIKAGRTAPYRARDDSAKILGTTITGSATAEVDAWLLNR